MAQASATDIGHIGKSPALDQSLERARRLALDQGHGSVTLEHLLFALTDDPEAATVLAASSISIDKLRTDVSAYLGRLGDQPPPDPRAGARPNGDLLRIIQLAATAARQSARGQIDGAIVLAAIVGDAATTAAGLLKAQGLTFEEVIRVLSRAAVSPLVAAPVAPAPPVAELRPAAAPAATALAAGMGATPNAFADQTPANQDGEAGKADRTPPSTDDMLASVRARVKQAEPPMIAVRQGSTRRQDTVALTEPQPVQRTDNPPVQADGLSRGPAANIAAAPVHQPVGPPASFDPPPPDRAAPQPAAAAPEFALATQTGGQQFPVSAPPSARPPPLPPQTPAAQAIRVEPAVSLTALRQIHAGDGPRRPPLPPAPPQRSQRDDPAHTLPRPEQRLADYRTELRPAVRSPAPMPAAMAPPAAQPSQRSAAASHTQPPPDPRWPLQPQTGHATPPLLAYDLAAAAADIPEGMRLGTPVTVDIRVPMPPPLGAAYGQVQPLRAMSLYLVAAADRFYIERLSAETVWIGGAPGHAPPDAPVWQFVLTPRQRGRLQMEIAVVVQRVGAYGLADEPAPPPEVVDVRVRGNPVATMRFAAVAIVAALTGAVVALYGGGPLAAGARAVAGLIGR